MRPLIYIICCFYAMSSYAQDDDDTRVTFELSEIAMLDLEPNNATVTLNVVAPNNAGEKATIVTANNNKWINFSSAVSAGTTRYISIVIEDGQVPPGIYLKLRTANYAGSGKGEKGVPTSVVTLNNSPQTIISNIKGAYTGNGENNGYKLTYELEIYDYKLLDFDQSATLSIRLTLTDF
ncbi:MAG: hypothetical protein PHW92_11800 [Lutibacter sp.]|nr:hypothetical protein [Lutibacter sp.]